ncbi:MFS transporter [Labrys wisconsinensis]|uniref:PPP family 3-phenylpropionic acid transporter n=1 Tax=Labrys wisconsinensis TaxID=425677 RepID=A0ABU0JFF7_9HYPH|nr:MFS transporter [Labrys wisconsinensis]MDQ0473022.1 PPP family 3-phenylpropionic acid transporter [Labrys wisconsinensis]
MTLSAPIDRHASRRAAWTTSATYALLLSGQGVYLPFFPIWLAHRGYDAREIGLLLAIPMLMRVFASAPFARIGDGRLGPRRTFLMMVCGMAFGYAGLPFMPEFWSLALMLTVASTFLAPTTPLLDTIVLDGVVQHGHDYGRIRQWGSLFWLLTAITMGKALTVLPAETIPPIMAILAALTALFGLALPDDRGTIRADAVRPERGDAPPRALFALFIAASACLQGAHSLLYSFATLIWQQRGFSSSEIGGLWAIGTITETALFLLGGNAAGRLGPYAMVAIGGAVGLLRWVLMGFDPGSGLTIGALQAMHALTFAAVHLGTMGWLNRFGGDRATRQGIVAAVVGAGLAGGTALAGVLYGSLGPHGYFAMAGVSAIGLALTAAAWSMERRGAA